MPKLIDHQERREEIAEATWRVILRDGVAAASVRTVATEAGRSIGSLRHVFTSQSELLVFALQLVIDRVSARVSTMPPRRTAVATVEAVAAEFIPLDHNRRREMEVYLALFSAASSNADLRGVRDSAHQALREGCRWMIGRLEASGDLTPDADRELETLRLHALVDGLAAHLVYEPIDADPEWARRVLVRHIRSLGTPAS